MVDARTLIGALMEKLGGQWTVLELPAIPGERAKVVLRSPSAEFTGLGRDLDEAYDALSQAVQWISGELSELTFG